MSSETKATVAGLSLFLALAVCGVQAAGPVPTDGLVTWLRAETGVMKDADGRVLRWLDQSGAGHDAGAATDWVVLSAVWGADDVVKAWINGGDPSTRSGATAVPANHKSARLGASPLGGANALDGDLAALLLFNVALDDTQRQTVEQYLIDKWLLGLDVTLADAATNGLFMWLEADTGVDPDAGGVFLWQDQSGLGGSINAGTGIVGKKPEWVLNGSPMGDRPVVRFDGDDFLNIDANGIFEGETFSWFLVTRTNTLAKDQALFTASYTSLDGGTTNPDDFSTNNLWASFFDVASSRYRSYARSLSGSIINPFPPQAILDVDKRPLSVQGASELQDRPVVRFGARDSLFSSDSVDSFTWFLVFKTDDASQTQFILDSGYNDIDGSPPDSHSFGASNCWGTFLEFSRVRSFSRSATGSIKTPFPPDTNSNGWTVISAMWDDEDSVRQWTDGVYDAARSGADAIPGKHKRIRIGAGMNGSAPLDGDLAAVLIYEGPMADADREAVEQYLTNKWISDLPALLTVTTNLVVWLEADTGVIADGNSLVQEWRDQSGQGNDALQLLSNDRPLWVQNASTNGTLPVIRFVGGGDYLDIGGPDDSLTIGGSSDFEGQTHSWFIVAAADDPGQLGTILNAAYRDIDGDGVPEDSFTSNVLWGSFLEGNEFKSFSRTATGSIRIAGPIQSSTEWVIFSNLWDGPNGGLVDVRLIDPGYFTFPATRTGADADPTLSNFMRLGGTAFGGGRAFVGDIGEVLLYNRVLSPGERTAIEAYLEAKWFAPAGDIDGDGDVTESDLVIFAQCMAGPDVMTPPGGCTATEFERSDLAFDGDVDLDDFRIFQEVY
jgi:hypothetical protein